MDKVAESVFVGTARDAGDESLLEDRDIDRIVSLTHTAPETGFPASVSVTRVAMMDGPRNERRRFELAVEAVLAALESGSRVLVHCSRGASRSPSVAAVAIAVHSGLDIGAAFDQVSRRRTVVDPHDALVGQAVDIYRDLK